MEQVTEATEKQKPQRKAPEAICPVELKKARESYSLVTTLLLNPGDTGLSSGKVFYGHFLMRMHVHWGNKVPTAGVTVTDTLNLYINPTFWNGLTVLQQIELVEHEIEHIVYLHPLRAKDYIETDKNASGRFKCANIAMDANINENKPNLCKENGVTIKRLNDELKKMGSKHRLDIKDPWEVHYPKLMQAAKENGDGKGDGFGDPTDDHGIWGESTDSKEMAENLIREAANKAQSSTGAGNMPSHMAQQISDLNKATVNWKRELRQFFVQSLKYDFERTRNRRNRRDIYGEGVRLQGRKKKPNLSIAVCVDSSGSVCNESFSQFFAEIGTIADMGVDITVIDADCGVAAVYKFDKKKQVQRFGNGGTAYQPAISKAKELKVDGVIYMGDGDSSDTPTDPGIPFLWAIVGNQNAPGNFGKTIRIVPEKQR